MNRYYPRSDFGGAHMSEDDEGAWLYRAEVIDALAQLPRELWPSDEALEAMGLEWYEIEAVDGAREDT